MKKLAIIAAMLLSTAFVSIAADTGNETVFKGNPDSKIIHKSTCHFASSTNCTATFSTRDAATAAGYTPCKSCKP